MRHVLFRHANYVLGLLGLLGGLAMYGLSNAAAAGALVVSDDLLWLLFTGGLVFAGLISGKIISKLYRWAYCDFLTETWNRKYFYARIRKEMQKRRKTGQRLCIALVDLDDFKRVNDEYGHDVGDCVLRQAARALKESVRESDVVIRLGGDEFAVIFAGTGLAKAQSIAEGIRQSIDRQCDYITASIGVVEATGDMELSELTRLVDASMYCAKKQKNSVNSVMARG